MNEDLTDFQTALQLMLKKEGHGAQKSLAKHIGKTPQYIRMLAGLEKSQKRTGTEKVRRAIAAHYGYEYEHFLQMGYRTLNGKESINGNKAHGLDPNLFLADYFMESVHNLKDILEPSNPIITSAILANLTAFTLASNLMRRQSEIQEQLTEQKSRLDHISNILSHHQPPKEITEERRGAWLDMKKAIGFDS